MDVVTYALSRKYTDNSIAGTSGVLAGKNCTIASITPVDGGNLVTFEWVADDSTTHTDTMFVQDGILGENDIAPTYDPTVTYSEGNLVVYNNELYRCTSTTTGEFDPSDWESISINEILGEIEIALAGKANTSDLATVATSGSYTDLSNTPTIPDELADLTDDSTHRLVTDAEKSTWNGKQSALTFDDVPTSGSSNPVKSSGIYTALGTKANTSDLATVATSGSYADLTNTPTVDNTPTENSNNLVKSGGVYTSVSSKIEKDTYRSYLGTITTGKWVQKNGAEYSTNAGLGIGINVSVGDVYYVTGVSVDRSYPLVVFFDSNSSAIGFLHDEGGHTEFKDCKVTIPTNCAYMWVNSEKNHETCVFSIETSSTTGDELKSAINSKGSIPIKWKQATYVYEERKYCSAPSNKAKVVIEDAGGYSYAKLVYDKTKRYRICGASRATNIFALVCTDENGVVLKKYEPYSGSDIVVRLKEYTDIPEETYYIYVNGYQSTKAYIEVAEERDVKSLKSGKVGVFIGDSITQGLNVLKWSITPYEDFPSVVGNLLGCTVYNGGLGGSTYSSNRKIDFATVVDCIVNGDFDDIYDGIDEYGLNQTAKLQYDMIKELDFTTVDFICIAYGTNDWNFGKTKAQVTEAMVNGIEALMTAYPNLAIYVATPINRFNINDSGEDADTYVNTTSGLKLIDICDAIIDGAKICHVPCKNMFYDCNISAQNKDRYMGDATHPNANGYKMIGEKIAGFINSN